MFPELKRKFHLYLISVTAAIIAVLFIMQACLYSFFVNKDFSQRSEQFHEQLLQSLSSKLVQIEEALNIFIQRNRLPYILESSDANSINYNSLYSAGNYCPDIRIIFISLPDGGGYFTNSYTEASFGGFTDEFDIRGRTNNDCGIWSYARDRQVDIHEKGDFWICTRPIFPPDGGTEPLGYVSALIGAEMSRFFRNSNDLFWQDSTYYLVTDKYTAPIYSRGKSETLDYAADINAVVSEKTIHECAKKDSAFTRRGVHIYSTQANSGRFRLISCIRNKYPHKLMMRMEIILLCIFLAVITLCIVIAIRITDIVIRDLENLCGNVREYMDKQDGIADKNIQNGRAVNVKDHAR